ncbi:MAG: glutaminase [Bacteroidota bacterium]
MQLNQIAQEVFDQVNKLEDTGETATYIPELARVSPTHFGVYIATMNDEGCGVGDYQQKFSIQSIAKVLSLCHAYHIIGDSIWDRVGVEPSGTAFNSLVQLEADNGIPRNPFLNAGALVIADILLSNLENPHEDFLDYVRDIADDPELAFSRAIAMSEKSVGYRNVALCNFIKSLGNIENEPEAVLDFYFNMCSLEMSCEQLSRLFMFLVDNGRHPLTNQQILTESQSKRINALMQTCGFYDESGEFAFKVGLPGKSGVGGGIIAIHPDQYAVTVWSPKLNEKGNSYKGMKFLEEFTSRSNLSIF